MSDISITSNNQPRFMIYWADLTAKEQGNFDYLDSEDKQDSASFVRYKNWVYDISEFMRVDGMAGITGWDGYHSDSYFSGILLKLCEDSDSVIMGRYCS